MPGQIAGGSSGEVRFKASKDAGVKACGSDGLVWGRDSFFAPHLVHTLQEVRAIYR
jgi:DhnA family fructose-bisphosphate aldolase class Ia